MTYDEWVEQHRNETMNEHNIQEWHRAGYMGQGRKALNLEGYDGHGKATYDTIKYGAPEAQVDWCQMSFGLKADKLYHFSAETNLGKFEGLEDLEAFGEFLKQYDVITVSQSGSYGSELEDLFSKSGAVLVSSAGNDDFDGVTGRFKDIGHSIGAVQYVGDSVHREGYSAVGEKLDFVCFHYHREGTSFTSPTYTSLCLDIMSKYDKVDKYTMYAVMKDLCIDLGEQGFDEHYGHGLPVLPKDTKIQMLENENQEIINLWTFRMLHNARNYVKRGDIIKKGDLICRMGNSGTRYTHLHIDAVEGLVKGYSLIDIENGFYRPLPEKIHSMITFDLFRYNPIITATYLDPTYHDYANVDYEHWAADTVPENRRETSSNFDVFYPLEGYALVLDAGTYSDGTKYVVIGVDEDMKFKDTEGHWAEEKIDEVTDDGMMQGYPDGEFKPNQAVTRAELAQVLYNMKYK